VIPVAAHDAFVDAVAHPGGVIDCRAPAEAVVPLDDEMMLVPEAPLLA